VRSTLLVLRGLDNCRLEVAGDVVGQRSVVENVASAVATSRIIGIKWLVDGQLIKVYPQTVALSFAIGKKSDLENWGAC
jgi:hypothetical protein